MTNLHYFASWRRHDVWIVAWAFQASSQECQVKNVYEPGVQECWIRWECWERSPAKARSELARTEYLTPALYSNTFKQATLNVTFKFTKNGREPSLLWSWWLQAMSNLESWRKDDCIFRILKKCTVSFSKKSREYYTKQENSGWWYWVDGQNRRLSARYTSPVSQTASD